MTDWTFALLPLFVLWRAKLPLAMKISAGGCLALGALGSISSIVRIAYINGLAPSANFFAHAGSIGLWSLVEPGLGIVAASLATLRPLFKSCMEHVKTSKQGTRTATPNEHNVPVKGGVVIQEQILYTGAERAGFRQLESPTYQFARPGTVTTIFAGKQKPPFASLSGQPIEMADQSFVGRSIFRQGDSDESHARS